MRNLSPQQKYLDSTFGLEDADLKRVREGLSQNDLEFMSISPHEGRLLQFLVRAFGLKKIVEVGTLLGYSTLCMAKALPKDGQVITIDKNPQTLSLARQYFAESSVSEKIAVFEGVALEVLSQVAQEGPFDMVFIDADKGGYVDYLAWAEQHVRPGGLIVGDNTFLWGGVWDQPTQARTGEGQIRKMKEFNSRLADPQRYNSTLIQTFEGLTVAQKLF